MSDKTRKYLPILKQIKRLGEKTKKHFCQKVRHGVHRLCQWVRQEHYKRQCSTESCTVATSVSRESIGIEKDVFKEEETNSAEGRIPRCSPSTCSRCPRQSVAGQRNRYKIGARRSTVSGTGVSRQKVQADTETGRFPSQNVSESRYWQNFKRRYAVRRPNSQALFADSEQILSGDRRSTTADDF